MRKRFDLGLPLIQTDSLTREDYQQAVVDAAREAGRLFLAAGNIERKPRPSPTPFRSSSPARTSTVLSPLPFRKACIR